MIKAPIMLTWIRQHFGQFVIANGGIRGSGFRLASIANGRIRGLGFYSKTVRGIDSSILDKNLEYPVLLVVVLIKKLGAECHYP